MENQSENKGAEIQAQSYLTCLVQATAQYLKTKAKQTFVENPKDIMRGLANSLTQVELTPKYINSINSKMEADNEAFEKIAEKQYGEDNVLESGERVVNRTSKIYNTILGRLNSMAQSKVDTVRDLPDEARKNLVGMLAAYQLNKTIDKIEV